ncbi:HD domain-containing protein [Bacillus sp. NP157]|nr:HD domain-containing protein [Bacillus sp. NP157]
MSSPITLAGITAPDSAYTRKAAALVAQVHDKAMLNHVQRSWWFADAIGRKRGMAFDREVVYLAAILHDLGLTEAYMTDQRFEVDGANAARALLLGDAYPEGKAQQVWDAIALHSAIGVAEYMGPEIALVHMGSHLDVLGMFVDDVSPAIIDDTLQLYPRLGFSAAFQAALAESVRRNPIRAAGTGLVDIGHRHVHGFALPNGCDLLDHSLLETWPGSRAEGIVAA